MSYLLLNKPFSCGPNKTSGIQSGIYIKRSVDIIDTLVIVS